MDPSGGTVEAEWRHFTDVVEAVEAFSDNFQNNQQSGGDHGVDPPMMGNLELLDGHNAKSASTASTASTAPTCADQDRRSWRDPSREERQTKFRLFRTAR